MPSHGHGFGSPPPGFGYNLEAPSSFWRGASYQTFLATATLCRGFLYGLNKTEAHGLPQFLELLKSRSSPDARRRGLLTVSNHISVIDDPLIWGVLPFSFHAWHGYQSHRWGFGSHDICFKGPIRSHFFTLGQTLPTHRLAHSPHGGLFQPTMTEAVRMFSQIRASPSGLPSYNPFVEQYSSHSPSWPSDCVDPFSDIAPQNPAGPPFYPSSPNDERNYLAPSRYASNSFSWIHIFPEGMIHQNQNYNMRYFKWGVARLILEPPVCPDFVPMWIEGTDQVMHESRTFPRFIPRAFNKISVTFGEPVDVEKRFGDLRARWKALHEKALLDAGNTAPFSDAEEVLLGLFTNEIAWLRNHPEAVGLREECALRVREEVLKLRRARGWPDEDPKASVAATWKREGPQREGEMNDGSWVKDT